MPVCFPEHLNRDLALALASRIPERVEHLPISFIVHVRERLRREHLGRIVANRRRPRSSRICGRAREISRRQQRARPRFERRSDIDIDIDIDIGAPIDGVRCAMRGTAVPRRAARWRRRHHRRRHRRRHSRRRRRMPRRRGAPTHRHYGRRHRCHRRAVPPLVASAPSFAADDDDHGRGARDDDDDDDDGAIDVVATRVDVAALARDGADEHRGTRASRSGPPRTTRGGDIDRARRCARARGFGCVCR